MRYVVMVLGPLPDDMTPAAMKVADGFRFSTDKALQLLSRAPGPVTRAVPEREARTVASVLRGAGLEVELREDSADGPVVIFEEEATAARESSSAVAERPEAVVESAGVDDFGTYYGDPSDSAALESDVVVTATDSGMVADSVVTDYRVADKSVADKSVADDSFADDTVADDTVADDSIDIAGTGSGSADVNVRDIPRDTDGAGRTVMAPPRDPMKTTLVRNPPQLESGGLRRRVASAATLPAFLTLLVTLLALAVTLLPALSAEEARRASSTANTFAATVEGLSGGLPLSAPIIRAELAQVAERSAARLPENGIDYLLVVDADGSVLASWYQAQLGLDSFPAPLREQALERAAAVLDGNDEPSNASWLDGLAASGRRLLSMVGVGTHSAAMEGATVRRLGVTAGAVVVGASPAPLQSAMTRALLTALLVGLIPVLFGVLAALSLTRSLREAITYLLAATDRISHGDFDQTVSLERDDELGQIARAVERMRLSLQTAMERLRRR